jgi:hypothetical protein
LIDWARSATFGNLLFNTCGKSAPSWVKIDEPGGPTEDKTDMEWKDILVIANPSIVEEEEEPAEAFFL